MEKLVNMSYWTGKRVLVTGASGLVGGHLVKSLITLKADVAVFERDIPTYSLYSQMNLSSQVTTFTGDLANSKQVTRAVVETNPDVVFHLGAQTIVGSALKNPVETFESNIQGTWNLLDAIRLYAKSISGVVVASSDKAYGTAMVLPYNESHPLHGDGPYDVSKSCTDLIAQSFAKTYEMPVTIARCGNIYGPGDCNWSRIIPGTIKSLISGVRPILRSDGSHLRDYIFAADVVDAYLLLGEKALGIRPGEAYNFSNDVAYSVNEIYSKICEVLMSKFVEPTYLHATKNEIQDQHLTSKKANDHFDWKSKYSLAEGLGETIPWYREILQNGHRNE